jgi:cell division protein FtsN
MSKWYVLDAGPFDTREEADAEHTRLKLDGA